MDNGTITLEQVLGAIQFLVKKSSEIQDDVKNAQDLVHSDPVVEGRFSSIGSSVNQLGEFLEDLHRRLVSLQSTPPPPYL
jgi:negative regulator of replication initiation